MSSSPISRSPDLKQLQDDGYELEVRAGHLLLHHVPYVTANRTVAFGTLVSTLDLAADRTVTPTTHVAMFQGDMPFDVAGTPLEKILHVSGDQDLGGGLVINHTFSSKPTTGAYADYYEKMSTYADILSAPAQAIAPDVTARTFKVIDATEPQSMFLYADTASTRAQIGAISEKLASRAVAIVGLGGSGAYILDYVSKTPVEEIHLFDGDRFLQHNAFRAPGAAARENLEGGPLKVDYFSAQYAAMRHGIVPHPYFIDHSNADELRAFEFVFLTMDPSPAKGHVVDVLQTNGNPFVDTGMGIYEEQGALAGLLRVSTSTPVHDAALTKQRIPIAAANGDAQANDYDQNIQIAELNALNASLAVIKWKKLRGFYRDLDHEHFTTYEIAGNHILNEDRDD
jgi:hypothetical protein